MSSDSLQSGFGNKKDIPLAAITLAEKTRKILRRTFPQFPDLYHAGILNLSTHARFTSPLRKYPDLIHLRLARAAMSGRPLNLEEILCLD